MRALVTGAGGFIASHLTEQLLRAGHTVRALVRYNSRSSLGYLEEAPAVILRPFNTYGPRQSARAVIPTILTQASPARAKFLWATCHPGAI